MIWYRTTTYDYDDWSPLQTIEDGPGAWVDAVTNGHVDTWTLLVNLERLVIAIPTNRSLKWAMVYIREDLIA